MIESKPNASITNPIDVFEKDTTYTYSIYIKPKEGYIFADNITAKIDNITLTDYRLAGNTIIFEYVYGEAKDVDIKITDMTYPVAGEKPIYTGKISNTIDYVLHEEIWYDDKGNIIIGEFEEGKEYTYYAIVATNSSIELPIYATVNDNNMEYKSNEGNLYVFTYKYKLEKIHLKLYLMVMVELFLIIKKL